MEPLPIDQCLPAIIDSLNQARSLILSAPPGAGKTTRVPRALYDAGLARHGEILILEPRRLAARMAAFRVAQEMGEKTGDTVGYSIRFENVAGPHTRIRFLTEAILARRMVHDPGLQGVSAVILDEFHERHLATDLALALLKRIQANNPELKVIIMSATLDVEPIASFLQNAYLMSVPGSLFDVVIEHEPKPSDRPLHEKAVSAVSRLCRSGCPGDILVFLPGAYEIRKSADALQPIADRMGLAIFPLHGDLPASDQKRAIDPAERRKVILATNVAETSITIPGIAAVVDSGLARFAGHSPWNGLPILSTEKISRSSAIQRAGRAGRTQAGTVLRLYTKEDFESRSEFDIPEIRRVDLAETALLLHGSGIRDLRAFPWFESPAKAAIDAAEMLLLKLHAVDPGGRISDTGRQMLELPLHPRLGRLIVEGKKQHVIEQCILLAALLSERDIRLTTRTRFGSKNSTIRTGASAESDLVELLDAFRSAELAGFEAGQIAAQGLDPGAVQAVGRSRRQIRRLLSRKSEWEDRSSSQGTEESVLIAALAAFPDRVFKRRKPNSRELLLAGGGSATLSQASVVHNPMFGVAVDADQRRQPNSRETGIVVRMASAIDIDWLAGLFPEEISETTELQWNERGKRVEQFRAVSYGQITLEEKTLPAAPSDAASQVLQSVVLARQLSDFRDSESLPVFQARLSLLQRHFPDENFPTFGEKEISEMVQRVCRGKTRLEEIVAVSIIDSLSGMLTERHRSLLNREAPERIKLKAGRTVKVHYESSRSPWIESRLQDFFGMSETPSICGTRVPLTIHLLAPNGRAVQVTNDLSGFWKKHYPSVRKELQRRYPKHAWPEL